MEKILLAKLSHYSHYMDFPGNTFVVQGQGAYMSKRFMGKTAKAVKVLPSKTFPTNSMCLRET